MKKLALLLGLASCGEVQEVGCQTDYDCREPRFCEVETGNCVYPEEEISIEDICNGQDDDNNGLVDELGCGEMWLVKDDHLYHFDIKTQEIKRKISGSGKLSPDGSKFIRTVDGRWEYFDTETFIPQYAGEAPSGNINGIGWVDNARFHYWLSSRSNTEIYIQDLSGASDLIYSANRNSVSTGPMAFDGAFFYIGLQIEEDREILKIGMDGSEEQLTNSEEGAGSPFYHNGRIYYTCFKVGTCSVTTSGTDEQVVLRPHMFRRIFDGKALYRDRYNGTLRMFMDLATDVTFEHTLIPEGYQAIEWRED